MSKRPRPKKKKVKDPKVSEETIPKAGWDIYSNKFKNGVLIDGRSGESKFFRGGRKRDIPLEKLESREDLRLEKELFRRWKAGEFDKKDKKK